MEWEKMTSKSIIEINGKEVEEIKTFYKDEFNGVEKWTTEISKIKYHEEIILPNKFIHLPLGLKNKELRFLSVLISNQDLINVVYDYKADDFIKVMGLESTNKKYDIIRKILNRLKEKSDIGLRKKISFLTIGEINPKNNLIRCMISDALYDVLFPEEWEDK